MSSPRILQIIRYVAHRKGPGTAREIVEHFQMPRAPVYQLIATPEKQDVLQPTSNNKNIELSANSLRSMIIAASNGQLRACFREALLSTAKTWAAVHACSSARAILAFMPQKKIGEIFLGRSFSAFTDLGKTTKNA